MEISRATNGRQADCEERSNIKIKKETNYRTPTVKMERSTYSSRRRNRPCRAWSMMMMIVSEIFNYTIKFKLYDIFETCPARPVWGPIWIECFRSA
jgi:hypothetical protein